METKSWNKMSYRERRVYQREFEYKGFKCTGCLADGYCAYDGKEYLYAHSIQALKFRVDCYLDKDLYDRYYC